MFGWAFKGGEDYFRHLDYIEWACRYNDSRVQWWSGKDGDKIKVGDPAFFWMNKTNSLFAGAGIYARGTCVALLPEGRGNDLDLQFWINNKIKEKRHPEYPHVEIQIESIHIHSEFLRRELLAKHPLFQSHYLITQDRGVSRKLDKEHVSELDRLLGSIPTEQAAVSLKNLDDEELRALALAWKAGPNRRGSKSRPRNPYIPAIALARSNGKCEACEWQAPFTLNGTPILEAHHIDGLDHDAIERVAAICPNCHAIITRGVEGKVINDALRESIARKEHKLQA